LSQDDKIRFIHKTFKIFNFKDALISLNSKKTPTKKKTLTSNNIFS